MRIRSHWLCVFLLGVAVGWAGEAREAHSFYQWAQKPPLGWNSWDCFATTITEAQAKAQADAMAKLLAPYGWQYLVVDIQWYEPQAKGFDYRKNAALVMDDFGRLWPATNRFPSAGNGAGFKPLSDYVHAKGLKFGVHLLRGIPRQAVTRNTTVLGTAVHAADIANTNSTCAWNGDMFGVDVSRPGGQEYYNSVFDLLAKWEVDFVKVDDISRPYHEDEITAIRRAIDRCGRPMVLSLSPGETPLTAGAHVSTHANMWRISDDFWDKWQLLRDQFARLRKWTPYRGRGHFPDADMLPLGVIGLGRHTHFTRDEQYTLMSLWAVARSPLILGADMTRLDAFTMGLLTNREVLAVDQDSTDNHELYDKNGLVAWAASLPGSPDKYVALFNTHEEATSESGVPVPIRFAELDLRERCYVRDLWQQKDLGQFRDEFSPTLPPHGAGLYRLSPDGAGHASASRHSSDAPVTLTQDDDAITLANGLLTARIEKRSGTLVSLRFNDLEFLAQGRGGANGGYWSSVGRGRPGSATAVIVRLDPATNGGARADVVCQLHNDPVNPSAPVDADYGYSLGRGEHWLYVYARLRHQPGYPAFSVGEARYCLKLNPEVFDYLYVDADRHRVMPSGFDWDHGAPLNLKEARRMTTGVHKGEAEHKYDYSAVLAETPAYGWTSTRHEVGLWLINPSIEYLGGGPTKAELTGHLDVNPAGLPTLLNMWVGSHYGGTTIAVATNEAWSKMVGPFVLYCNASGTAANASANATAPAAPALQAEQGALWHDALTQASREAAQWPYAWLAEPDYPSAAQRSTLTGQLLLKDPFAPELKLTNAWVGLSAPDYVPPRVGYGWGFRRMGTNFGRWPGTMRTNPAVGAPGFGYGRGGFPPYVDWQRDAKFYQFWTKPDVNGRFTLRNVRPGSYSLHAFADGVLGEFTLTNVSLAPGQSLSLGALNWVPLRFGRTLWQIGVPDRTAREFRHGDHFWQWGLYFDYPKEFPHDVNFVIGKSDWRKDWNFVQPPRIETRDVPMVGEEEEEAPPSRGPLVGKQVRSSTWSICFELPKAVSGRATLRLAFCGTHVGCNVEVIANGASVGETGPLPPTSAMQRDGIRAYWVERDISFDANLLKPGTNVIQLLSHAQSWSQGVMYDCVRLELGDGSRK